MVARHKLLELPEIRDSRGLLTFVQGVNLPFDVKRLFVLSDLVPGTGRGSHAHRAQHQLIFMISGCARVLIDYGLTQENVILDKPSLALHVPPMLWLELLDFTPGAACIVLASDVYEESDYIRDHGQFLKLTG